MTAPQQLTAVAATAHAFLAPSSAARWVVCPGSAAMEARYPEQGDKDAAADGTACHWVMQQLFDGWAPDQLLADGKTESGHPLTREMVDAALMLYDDVVATLAEFGMQARGNVIVEQRVAIPRVHPSANWGTPDVRAWVCLRDGRAFLFVWDLKYGHKHVDAFENWQCIDYSAGLLDEARGRIPEDRITVVMRVVQPRSYHRDGPIREWRIRASDLAPYVHRLAMAADEATSPTAQCKPQPDACENCTARHACEALQRAAYRGMDLARQAQATELSPAAAGLELRYLTDAAKLMEARMTGLQAQVEALARQGHAVPHWSLTPGVAREGWTKPAAEVIALGSMLGLNLTKEPDVITPTQARALAKRQGLPESVIGVYAARPSGALRLTVDDGTDARKVFASR